MTNFFKKLISRSGNNPATSANVSSVDASTYVSPTLSNPQATTVQPVIAGDYINYKPEPNANEVVERVVLSEHGFNLAARSAGDPALLRSSLNRIYHGHLVDINQNENDQIAYRQQREKELAELDKQRVDMDAEKNKIEQNFIPLKEQELKQHKDKIYELKINRAEQELLSEYKPFWLFLYTSLSVLMALFLVFFYANVIYNAFYRNIIQEIAASSTSDIGLLLNALFTEKLFEQNKMVLFQVFITASLFFGFGLLPHKIMQHDKSKQPALKWIKLTAALGVALTVEVLLAQKVHANIEAVKQMIYNDDQYVHVPWYASGMFYTIVIMGFGVYMVWAYFLELATDMYDKRDNGKVVKLHIERINEIITAIQQEISNLKARVNELEAAMQKNRINYNYIKQLITARIFDKALLKRNIEQFYGGWLKHLSSADHLKPKIEECEKVYKEFLAVVDNPERNQTPIIPTLIVLLIMTLTWIIPGTWEKANAQADKQQMNIVVVLDLSDRLINAGQLHADSTLIMAAFNRFYQHVQFNNIFIKSKDCFKIVVAPQQGTPYALYQLLEKLQLNMADISMSEKKKCINDFKQQLPARINELYKLAYRGNQRKNYPGCDIWQYVNEQLKTDIRANFNNIVVFITDGYMDFENPKHAINKGNLHTTTHFINKLQGPDWQKQADNDGYGILPIRYNWLNTRVVVAGINSKKVNNLTETDKLKYFWLKWLHDSGFGKADCIVMSSPGKMTLLIDEFFNQ